MTTTSAATVAAVPAAFRFYWHDCWCPDFFLQAGFHVDYCPTHGFPWRAEIEFEQPLNHCGCELCHTNLHSLLMGVAEGNPHSRKARLLPENRRTPRLAVPPE